MPKKQRRDRQASDQFQKERPSTSNLDVEEAPSLELHSIPQSEAQDQPQWLTPPLQGLIHKDYRHGLRQHSFSYRVSIERPAPDKALLQLGQTLWPAMPKRYLKEGQLHTEEQQIRFILNLIQDKLEEAGNYCSDKPLITPESPNGFHIIQPCLHQENGWRLTAAIWNVVASELGDDPEEVIPGKRIRLSKEIKRCQALGLRGFNSLHFLRSADEAGLPWLPLVGKVYQFGYGKASRLLSSSLTDQTPAIATLIARSKVETALLLRKSGLPGAQHIIVNSRENAVKAAEKLGFPVVLKPYDMERGSGVFCGLFTADQVGEAYAQASQITKNLIVERQARGQDYRIHVVRGKIHGVLLRQPGGVSGDGIHTLARLVELENESRANAEDDRRFLHPLKIDSESESLLALQELSWQSIPAPGRFIRLRWACNVSSGGIPIPVELASVHPDNHVLARRVCEQLRLDVAGIDLLIEDIATSWQRTEACICEVNAQPQMHTSLHPLLLKEMLGPAMGRLPTVLLLSARESREAIVQSVAGLRNLGLNPGVLYADQRTLDGNQMSHRWSSIPAAIESLLIDRSIDALLVSCDMRRGLRQGWPIPRADAVLVDTGGCDAAGLQEMGRQSALALELRPKRIAVGGEGSQDLIRNLKPGPGVEVGPAPGDWRHTVKTLLQASPQLPERSREETQSPNGSWEALADQWAEDLDRVNDAFGIPLFADFVGDVSNQDLLDGGCGHGRSSMVFARMGARVLGVDISPSMIEIASKNPDALRLGVRFQVLSTNNLEGLSTGSFDCVTSVMALMDTADLNGVLHEYARVLKPGGCLAIMIRHPCFFTKGFSVTRQPDGPGGHITASDYFRDDVYVEKLRLGKGEGHALHVTRFPYTLSSYLQGLSKSGLTLTAIEEPRPNKLMLERMPNLHFWNRHAALYLFLKAVKA